MTPHAVVHRSPVHSKTTIVRDPGGCKSLHRCRASHIMQTIASFIVNFAVVDEAPKLRLM